MRSYKYNAESYIFMIVFAFALLITILFGDTLWQKDTRDEDPVERAVAHVDAMEAAKVKGIAEQKGSLRNERSNKIFK